MDILLVPDLHLGSGTAIGKDLYNTGLNSRIQDQKDLLEFVFKQAKHNFIDRMILLGDIWESPKPDPTVVHIFLEWLIKCSKEFDVDIIQGNHDFIRGGSNKISMLDCIDLTKIKNCTIHTSIGSYIEDNFYIVYVPYTDMRQLGARTADNAKIALKNQISNVIRKDKPKNCLKICCGHLALENSFWVGNEISDDHNEIFVTKDMIKELGFDYVFMGHVHKPQILSKKPFMAHIGSLDKTKFTGPDSTDKQIFLFNEDETYESIKLPCRNLIDITINIPETEQNETEFVINSMKLMNRDFKNSIARIKIEANSNEYKYVDRKKISNFIYKSGAFNISSITEIKHSEQVLKKKVDIDENINHYKAVDIFVKTLNGTDEFKENVSKTCKNIIKEVTPK